MTNRPTLGMLQLAHTPVRCGIGSLYSLRPPAVAGEERGVNGTELEARRGSSELADERTLGLQACEAQPQTVPIGKRTAHQVL